MEQKNPFYLWGEKADLIGLKEELRFVDSFLSNVESGKKSVLSVTSLPGCGKSSFLEKIASVCESRAFVVSFVRFEFGESHFETISQFLPISADRSSKPVIVILDDLDKAKNFRSLLVEIQNLSSSLKVGFIISSLVQLDFPGARSIHLSEFGSFESHELISNSLKSTSIKMGEECISTLLDESSGNPRLLKLIGYFLFEKLKPNEKIITKGHYLSLFPQILSFIAKEWFSRLLAGVSKKEALILRLFSNTSTLSVSQMASSLKIPLSQVTSMVIRLEKKGFLQKVERGKYKIFSKIFAKYLLSLNSSL